MPCDTRSGEIRDVPFSLQDIIPRVVPSGLIYPPSSVRDLHHPAIGPLLAQYCRGSSGIDFIEHIKTSKLVRDAIGS